jgi:hypothetical protein
VRWFVLCGGRAGLCDADDGLPDGLEAEAFHDVEVAVSAAERYGLRLVPVLLDFLWCHPAREIAGVRCGGRRDVLVDGGARTRLLQHVLRPLLARFGGRNGIAAWDLINEPEWVTFSWGTWDPRHAVLPDAMAAYISDASALVHECTDHQATVGLASAASLPRVRGLGLDLYQVHWYDKLEAVTPLETPVATLNLDAPLILGEFPTRGSCRSPAAIVETAQRAGYLGALAWSLQATDEATDADATWQWLAGAMR